MSAVKYYAQTIIKHYLEHLLLVVVGCQTLYIFILIAITGGYQAYEHNALILGLEIATCVFYIVYGFYKILKVKIKE